MRTDAPAHAAADGNGAGKVGISASVAVGQTLPPHPWKYLPCDGGENRNRAIVLARQVETIAPLIAI